MHDTILSCTTFNCTGITLRTHSLAVCAHDVYILQVAFYIHTYVCVLTRRIIYQLTKS